MADAPSHPLLSYQPIRSLFQLGYASTVIIRLPLWISTALVPSLRPHPAWSAKQALLNNVAYAVTDVKSRIGITDKLSLEPGKEGPRFQVVQPAAATLYRGPLKSEAVKPEPVGATWFPRAPAEDVDMASKMVMLYIHGGAFVDGNGREEYAGYGARNMVVRSGMDFVMSVQYRLSGWSGLCPFPAAMQDALTAYLFLVREAGVAPSNIVLCGDSAGGNLAIAVLRYIHDFGTELGIPAPRCATLFSPWIAPLDFGTIDASPRRSTDFLPTSFLRWGALAYSAGHQDAARNAYITPAGSPFATPVPMFVSVGAEEILRDSIILWAEQMKSVHGNAVDVYLEEAALHDTFLLGALLGFEESADKVAEQVGAFVRGC
ncbi:alpha/beta hydrolase fold-3 domain-containing protein [Stachybotrys elegans]|uniref:Alpha/beta hydrolase fold-3 domain-containing protein n=1 Tax=Stachybotrys elegans TaxID=80388 RepID=A0A8K0WMK8_9HYPO|nr:alpha/beta hydrolase fold-3 domain-containing protein [Stachybotrys elegans]